MARSPKKVQIAQAALPLFLCHGFKGTSVDMVVKASGVSKPTIYKHFSDKASLMAFVIDSWLREPTTAPLTCALSEARRAPNKQTSLALLEQLLIEQAWAPQTFELYRLVLAEGWRFEAARKAFHAEFEIPCRTLVRAWAMEESISENLAQAIFSQFVLERLWSVPRIDTFESSDLPVTAPSTTQSK